MNYPAWSGFSEYGRAYCKLSGKKYPAGDYYLRFMCLQDGYDNFILPDVSGGGEKNNLIHAYIHDGKLFFNQVSTGISSVEDDAEVLGVERYTIDGKATDASSKGIVVERQKMANGKTRSVKRLSF